MDDKIVGRNRKAQFQYHLGARFEAGLALKGSEVKSLREGQVGFEDSYAVVRNGEVFLRSLKIAPYDKAFGGGHQPDAERKLLLKRSEIRKITQKIQEKGMTLIPVSIYFKNGWAKVELALAQGKRQYDKRAAIEERENKRDLARLHREKRKWTGQR
ncbi:MAG: SsrA-binding protein SmpB [Calditrichota bacterium]